MPAVLAPINPDVLDWAMQEAGFDKAALAAKVKEDVGLVEQWLKGAAQPTTGQFDKITKALARSRSFFFLPRPPATHQVPVAFRATPGGRGQDLLEADVAAVRRARRVQRLTRWSRERVRDSVPTLPKVSTDASAVKAADVLREWLGWSPERQTQAKSATEVTKDLRRTLEAHGLIAMQQPIGRAGCRGFSLLDPVAPVVAVNSAYTTEARTFSYVHELGHLVRGTEAICTGALDQGLERWCEEFAAALLLPRSVLLKYVNDLVGVGAKVTNPSQVTRVANHFKISRLATATALQQAQRADQLLWNEIKAQSDLRKKQGGGPAGDPQTLPVIRVREWGRTPTRLLIEAADQGALSRPDLLEYLHLSSSEVNEVRRLLTSSSVDDED